MPKAPPLPPFIEWEDIGRAWKIERLEPSESLPQGAESAEVWRDDDCVLKAKIGGTIEGRLVDMYPDVEGGSSIPVFELKGSDGRGILDYEIGSCAVGRILSSEWKDEHSDPPVVGYQAEILSSGARWVNRHRDPSDAKWLSEWYLNGPRHGFVYHRRSVTRSTESYSRERRLPNKQEDSFEYTHQIGGASFAFVETDGVSFLVQRTPNGLGPSWSECLSIEYRPSWGGIPGPDVREAIGALVGFVIGRELINVGYTRFDEAGYPMEQVALDPRKDNLVSLCQRSADFSLVDVDTTRGGGGVEPLLRNLVPGYLTLKDNLRLKEALRCYWLAQELPIGLNLPSLSTGIETLASSWFDSRKSKTKGVYMQKKDFDALLKTELEAAGARLEGREYGDRILSRLRGSYNMGANDRLRFFFDEIGLPVGDDEWRAIAERNPMAHGASSVFDGSANERMRKATRVYQTLFHRVLLKIVGYEGDYTDYGTLGLPRRLIDEPSGTV